MPKAKPRAKAPRAHRKKRPNEHWHDVGDAAELARTPLQQIQVHGTRMALSCADGVFGAIHGTCNHAGGPLGQGTLEGDYVVCPWHQWRFHRIEGHGERGFEEDVVPAYRVRVRGGRVQVSVTPHVKRRRKQHAPHPLAREPERAARPGARGRHLDHRDERRLPALLDLRRAARGGARARRRSSAARRGGSGCASSPSATARATTRSPRAPAPGPARSRRWIPKTSSTASTRRWCTGPTCS